MRPKYMKPPTMIFPVASFLAPRATKNTKLYVQSLKTASTPLTVRGSLRLEAPTSSYRRAFTNSFSSFVNHLASSGKSEIVKYKMNEKKTVAAPSADAGE